MKGNPVTVTDITAQIAARDGAAVTVYTRSTPFCAKCVATKRALDRRGVTYTEVDLAHDPDATDGSQTAVAVLWGKADASGGDAPAVALVRGPAIVNRHDLVFAGTPSEPEITAAHAALAAAGILVR